jgi:hypothetical protein
MSLPLTALRVDGISERTNDKPEQNYQRCFAKSESDKLEADYEVGYGLPSRTTLNPTDLVLPTRVPIRGLKPRRLGQAGAVFRTFLKRSG